MTNNLTDNFTNIDKVAKVEVTMRAELGRTKLSLIDTVEYDTGSIIPLNTLNNEAINIYVDDILIAKGAIVAVEDSYGIKITEIIENEMTEVK